MSSTSNIAEPSAPGATGTRRLTETLVTCNIGTTLFLKLCGFMEDCQARILDVDEGHVRFRVGRTFLDRWWHGLWGHPPLEVRLDIRPAQSDGHGVPRTAAGNTAVDVRIRPLGPRWTDERFQICAGRVLRRLRQHLMTH